MLLNIDSALLRIILQIYFWVMLTLLAIIGDQCGKCVVKLKLLRVQAVGINWMTGWIQGFGLILFFFRTWRLPGVPILGWLMLLGTVLSPAGHLVITGLVRTVHIDARCTFGIGLVLSTAPTNTFSVTPVNGKPYTVVANAQAINSDNGGLVGIYWKANRDLSFRAQPQDVLGKWTCGDMGNNITYPASTTAANILKDLQLKNYLYPNFVTQATQSGQSEQFTHLVAWSSTVNDNANSPFDIRASIDLTANTNDNKIMQSFHCSINTSAADGILSLIQIQSTLTQWAPTFQGAMYDGSGTPASNGVGPIIERLLNSMVMVEGGSNNLLQVPTRDLTQGCLADQTNFPTVAIALSVLVGSLFLASAIYWTTMLKAIRSASRAGRPKELPRDIPNGLVLWMLQAAYESVRVRGDVGRPTGTKDLVNWDYTHTGTVIRHIKPGQEMLLNDPRLGGEM